MRFLPVWIFAALLQWGRDQLIAETSSRRQTIPTTIRLQWGRDQLIAETKLGMKDWIDEMELQWGRDQLIAETHVAVACLNSASACFNGAAIN